MAKWARITLSHNKRENLALKYIKNYEQTYTEMYRCLLVLTANSALQPAALQYNKFILSQCW